VARVQRCRRVNVSLYRAPLSRLFGLSGEVSGVTPRFSGLFWTAVVNNGLDDPSNFFYSVGEMHAAPSLGEFEQMLLPAILRFGDNAYGVTRAQQSNRRLPELEGCELAGLTYA
jgi:hypothetical protein